jgi:hypothetical protein
VLNRRPRIADVLASGRGIRFRTGRLLGALGLMTISPEVADAGRRSDERDDSQGRTKDEAQDNPDDNAKKTKDEQKADRKNESDTSNEDRNTGDKSGKSGKHDQNGERSASDESSEQNESGGGKGRGDSPRRNADSDSTTRESASAIDESHHQGGQHVRDFAQRADRAPDEPPPDDVPDATTVTPANPNVFIDDFPDTSLNDLVVQGNDNVLASVSTSGGFAFARSGDVVAVTGPDGASIIQTGDVSAGTRGTFPAEPSDEGGNNNADFLS